MMRGIMATVLIVAVVVGAFVLIQSGVFTSRPRPSPTPSLTASAGPSSSPTPTPTGSPPATPSPSPTPVDTSVVASAVVVPLDDADLAAKATGVVSNVYVEEGSEAFANQLLVKLDPSSYQAA